MHKMQALLIKLHFKGVGVVINPPTNWESQFISAGFKTTFDSNKKNTNTLVFINDKKEFLAFLNNQLAFIELDSTLWVAYPKGTSKVKTDINRDILRITAEEFYLSTVSAISIDNTWSALRFRPIDKVGK